MNIHPRMEAVIEAHGRHLEKMVEVAEQEAAEKRTRGIPHCVHEFKNRWLELDQAAYAACPQNSDNPWIRLRRIVLGARVGAGDIRSYRSEFRKAIQDLTGWNPGARPFKEGNSLADVGQCLTADDMRAVVWAIWQQNPKAVRLVNYRYVYSAAEENRGTNADAQLYLVGRSSRRPGDVGLLHKNGVWVIGFTSPQAYQPLRVFVCD